MKKNLCTRALSALLVCVLIAGAVISVPVTEAKAAAKATKITLSAKKQTTYVGKSFTLKVASVKPKNASKKVKYASNKPEVASVNAKGKVTGNSEGTAVITVTSATNKKAVAKCTVTVKSSALAVTSIQTAKSLVMKTGGKAKIQWGVTPGEADKTITFSSSKPSIVKVDKKGNLKAGKKAGSAKITLTALSGTKATIKVSVKKKVTLAQKVTLDTTAVSLEKGQTQKLNAAVTPAKAAGKKVFWYSSNASVATVSADGTVTAVGAGSAVITAAASDASGKNASCTVTVTEPVVINPDTTPVNPDPGPVVPTDVSVTAVELNHTAICVKANEILALTATVVPANATNKIITWSTSNAAVAAVANGVVTPVSGGVAVITATAANGVSASCTVTVVAKESANFSTEYEYIYVLDKKAESYRVTRGDVSRAVTVAKAAEKYNLYTQQIDRNDWNDDFLKNNWSKIDKEHIANWMPEVSLDQIEVVNDGSVVTVSAKDKTVSFTLMEDGSVVVDTENKTVVISDIRIAKNEGVVTITMVADINDGMEFRILMDKQSVTFEKKTGGIYKTIANCQSDDSSYSFKMNTTYYGEIMDQMGISFDIDSVAVENVYTK